ncbi:hypothetical protein AX15_001643 [Amanita polypyramis BW_CC]|nr:hypothetical protein AX15_001643 [Amanita polypyramis BW_CC]
MRQSTISSTQPEIHTARRRSSTTSAYRPRPRLYSPSHYSPFRIRARSGNEQDPRHPHDKHSTHVHVTIAPIPPTVLKTTDSGYGGWTESFGDDGGSDDSLWGEGDEHDKRRAQHGEAAPVELVYVPPQFIGRYSVGYEIGTEEEDFDVGIGEERIEEHRGINGTPHVSSGLTTPKVTDDPQPTKDPEMVKRDSFAAPTFASPSPIPTVIIASFPLPLQETQAPKHVPDAAEDVLPDRVGEQDLQDTPTRRSSSSRDRLCAPRSRSRSYSRSRTPSPAVDTLSSDIIQIVAPVPVSVRRMSSSVSPPDVPSPSSLLSPPAQRGRSSSCQDLPGWSRQQRGRSSTRTSPSYSDRERQSSGDSPMGSLSPDSSFVRVTSIVGGVYASGRTDRERLKEKERREDKEQCKERERGREKERGRDRTTRRPSQSLSPDFETGTAMREEFSTEGRAGCVPSTNGRSALTTEEAHDAAAIAQLSTTASPLEVAKSSHIPYIDQGNGKLKEDEDQRRIQPTPSNSPVLTMKVPSAGRVAPKVDTTFQASSRTRRTSPQTRTHSPNNTLLTSISHNQHSHTQSPVNSHSPMMNNLSNPSVRSPIKGKAPLLVPSPHLVEPSTSLSISPPGVNESLHPITPQRSQSPESPTAKEPTIVEKAVGIVSSAGAFFGLWHS